MSKHSITTTTMLMAPVYIERGLQSLFEETGWRAAIEEEFNDWYAGGCNASRIEQHVLLVQSNEVKELLERANQASQAALLEHVFEGSLASYLFECFKAKEHVSTDVEIGLITQSLKKFLAKAA